MEPVNPYAPPAASLEPTSPGGAWRQGKVLVMRPDGILPPLCVKCGEPAEQPIKPTKLYWHHPALYLLALFALLVYAIVAMIVRKQATVGLGLCARHRKRRLAGQLLGLLGFVAGVAMMILGGVNESCGLALGGLIVLLGSLIAGVILARIVLPERIDHDYVRLKGCGEAFLQNLPDFHG